MIACSSDVLLGSLFFAYYVVGKYVLLDAAIGSLNGTRAGLSVFFTMQDSGTESVFCIPFGRNDKLH